MPTYKFAIQVFDKATGEPKNGIVVTASVGRAGVSGAVTTGLSMIDLGFGGFFFLSYEADVEGDWFLMPFSAATDIEPLRGSWASIEVPRIDATITSRLSDSDWVTGLANILAAISEVVTNVWTNPTRTLTSFGTLVIDIWNNSVRTLTSSSGGASAEEVWGYQTRTLTSTKEQVIEQMSGDNLSIRRGDIYTYDFTGLGSLAGRTSLYVTMKKNKNLEDSDSIVQTSESGGLIVLNGSSESLTSSWASISVLDENVGNIRLTLKPELTSLFIPVKENYFDVQFSNSSGTFTPREGSYEITADVTRRLT